MIPAAASNPQTRLFLGEGDFSYTLALLKKHPRTRNIITTTELRKESELNFAYGEGIIANRNGIKKLKKDNHLNIETYYEVDATKLHEEGMFKDDKFDRIHFTMPHNGESFDTGGLRKIISDFFISAAQVQDIGGRIHMVLPKHLDDWKDCLFLGNNYGIYDASKGSNYILIKKRQFKEEAKLRFPGYVHATTTSHASSSKDVTKYLREYIFEKTNDARKLAHYLPRDVRSLSKLNHPVLPTIATDSDSSDYDEADAEEADASDSD